MTDVGEATPLRVRSPGEIEAVLGLLPDPVVIIDEAMCVVAANRAAECFFGRRIDEFRGRAPFEVIHPDDLPLLLSSFEEVLNKEVGSPIELRVRAADGEWRLVELVGGTHHYPGGLWQVSTFRDLTQRRRWEVAAAQPERFRTVVESAAVVLLLLDTSGSIHSVSGAMCRQLGHDPSRVVGSRLVDWVVDGERGQVGALLDDATRRPGLTVFEAMLRHKDGRAIPYQLSVVNLLDDPVVSGLVVSGQDISSRRALEERLAHLANHDPLTGLANRARLLEHLDACRTSALAPERLGVLFLDLDRFKRVNDLYGHDVGDHLLVTIGRRLRAAVRPLDLVARLGGDEFVVVCPDLESPRALAALANRLEAVVADPMKIGGVTVQVFTSVGMITGDAATTAESLLAEADGAMYAVKQRRRGHTSGTRLRVAERRELAEHLRVALAGDPADAGLCVHYQPIVDVSNGRTVAAEALVRWDHPTLGMLQPLQFLAVAEDAGLDVALGSWVLRTAAAQLESWNRSAKTALSAISVNLFAAQLADPGFEALVLDVISDSGIEPSRLCLEVTETAMLERVAGGRTGEAIVRLASIAEHGVRLAIDDFGTGYSSLTHVRDYPADVLKIDRTFVADVLTDDAAAGICAAVVTLAHATGKWIIAEGVETPEQLARVAELGADHAQGFLFGAAVPAAQFHRS